jgi:trans-aconitate methyltransferase
MTQPYHPYIFKDGHFVGEFETMYRDGSSQAFDPWFQDDVRAHPILALLDGIKASSVLDLGCGKGALTDAIRQRTGAANIRGIDCSPTAIRIAKQRYRGIAFQVANVPKAVRRWGNQDLVVASEVLSYIPTWADVIADMLATGKLICVGLFVPKNPSGYVPSHETLVKAISSHGTITRAMDLGHDRVLYLARAIPSGAGQGL